MNECDDSVDKTTPTERAHAPQSVKGGNNQGPAALSTSLLGDIIDGKRMSRERTGARKRTPVLDRARFTAGIVSLYEAVLSEPIPEKMLRLVEEIGKQERKS